MSKEKQIEETAQELYEMLMLEADCPLSGQDCSIIADLLINKGWSKQEWISVDERLPEESGWYLVNIITPFDLEFISLSHYSKGYGWRNPDTVTHWMPLPEAPKMKGE